jgi:hypothetical protein
MFNRKSQEIKELRAELAKAHAATQEWANVWKDVVKERSLWDNSAKRWEERYNVAEGQLEAQRNLRTRNWGSALTLTEKVAQIHTLSAP